MKSWIGEFVALVLFIVLGIAGFIAAGQIAGMAFDPLGSRTAPYVIGGGVVLLSLACGLRLLISKGKAKTVSLEQMGGVEDVVPRRDLLEALVLLGFVMIYVFALFELRVPFSLATLCLVPAAACLIERGVRPRILAIATATGALLGFGGELLFTKVFFVDLPTLW